MFIFHFKGSIYYFSNANLIGIHPTVSPRNLDFPDNKKRIISFRVEKKLKKKTEIIKLRRSSYHYHMGRSIIPHAMIVLLVSASLVAALPRSDLASTIEHYPSTLDAPLTDMNWCGEDPQNDSGVVLLTAKGSVYRSEDRGATW